MKVSAKENGGTIKVLAFKTFQEAQAVNERLFAEMNRAGLLSYGTTVYAEIEETEFGFTFVILPIAEPFLTESEKQQVMQL